MKLEDLEAKLGIANMGEEEKLALVKDIQANIPALKAEQRVLEAKTQANLVVEAIKKIKEGLEARFDELNGIVDVKVRNITSGKDGLQGPKGDQGDRGFDGTNGKDGYNGKDGIDGVDGKDGVGVQDAYIDFDGSLIIKLTDGKELNVGEVVPMDVAEKIKIIGNGGGTSQSVLDSIAALQSTIATYGTMATQNANNVAITGGTINGATVGATTPAAGTFTTLTGNGTSQFGRGSANYVQIVGGSAGVDPVISMQGSDTNIDAVLQPKGTGAVQAQATTSTATGGNARGANAVDWQTFRFSAGQVASGQYSVLSGGYQNQSSAFNATIAGGSNNLANNTSTFVGGGVSNTSSGAYSASVAGASNSALGFYNFIGGGFTNSGTASSAVTTQSGTMNATTAVTLSGSNASIKVGQFISGTSIANDTYVSAISGTSLTLSKNASGSSTSTLSFYTPHGVVVGGGNNQATGSYSFIGGGGDAGTASNRNVASGDWSTVAGGVKNVASGIASFIGGGGYSGASIQGNTASGTGSAIVGGFNNTNSGYASSILGGATNTNSSDYATISGFYGTTRGIAGNNVFSAGGIPVAATVGGSQTAIIVLGRQTTDATATVLCSNSSAAGTNNQVILPNNSAYYFRGTVVAGVTGGGNTKGWTIEGVIKRGANAASTTVVGVTVSSMYADAGAVTWTIAAAADTTNGGLKITATGQAATTIRWVCKIETTEMTY